VKNDDWHLVTQNDDYLKLSIGRLSQTELIWTQQFAHLIRDFIGDGNREYVINDIGCNVGHFARTLESIHSKVHYRGVDISKTYLAFAASYFPHLNFYQQDFATTDLSNSFYSCDFSVISATLEHIENYDQFLKNVFDTTSKMVLLRTFIGKSNEKDYCRKNDALESYLIWQFTLRDLVNKDYNNNWAVEEIVDMATLGRPTMVCGSIRRTQHILKFVNNRLK
jgi:hypothetical protein